MILTCPQCAARFSVEAALLAPHGRNVRCAKCKHTWHQLPDPEELPQVEAANPDDSADIDADFERLSGTSQIGERADSEGKTPDLPKALMGAANDSDDLASPETTKARKTKILWALAGFAVVFIPIVGVMGLAQESVVRGWPASYALYKALGIEKPVEGEGLAFEKIQAKLVRNDNGSIFLNVHGRILNLKSEDRVIPPIQAVLKDEKGGDLDTWAIKPPASTIKAEGMLSFTAETAFTHEQAVSLHLKFAPGLVGEATPKTASKDAGNNQAHPPADIAHPSDPAKASESPPPADVPPHPESPPAHTGNSESHSDHH